MVQWAGMYPVMMAFNGHAYLFSNTCCTKNSDTFVISSYRYHKVAHFFNLYIAILMKSSHMVE